MLNRHRITLAILGGIATLAAVVLWIAPSEATLGEGVKLVFIHGALMMTGMLGIYVAGLTGLAAAITSRDDIFIWAKTIGWVGLGTFTSGLLMSLPAGSVNWGGVFFAEPRMQVAANNVALGLVALILVSMIKNVRINGVVLFIYAIALGWTTANAPNVLHPDNPIGTSPSRAIQLSFATLLFLCIAAAGWIVWRIRYTEPAEESAT